ncbi:hypothetical protein JXA40_05015 [bacterium]|nr:hypothetical protein [candidate division CSSED10-310 bacterium]
MISGEIHHLVERADGFRFYLDSAFCFLLEHFREPDIDTDMARFGVNVAEVPDMIRMLEKADLI